MESPKIYMIVNKPYGYLSQFTDKYGRKTLSDLGKFPKEIYPVGRLDMDSEGLLFLTNDKKLNDRLINPKYGHEREYWAQVEGKPEIEQLKILEAGVIIERQRTLPAIVKLFDEPPEIEDRVPPIRFRQNIPTSWIFLTIKEGRNRQVRKMTASIGFPTLRLIRVRIANIKLGELTPGGFRHLIPEEIRHLYNLLDYPSFSA